MRQPTSKTAQSFVWQFTLRRALIAMALLGLWMADCLDSVRQRQQWMQRLGDGTTGNSCYVRGCQDSEWFEDYRSCCPVAWQIFGAEPLWIIRLDGDEYSQVEAIEIARLFPEVSLVRSSDRDIVDQVKLHREPHAYASRLEAMLAW